MPSIYQEFLNTLLQVNEEYDLQHYSDIFGIDMDYSWPQFEVSRKP